MAMTIPSPISAATAKWWLEKIMKSLWAFLLWIITKPQQVIAAWLAAWSFLLYRMYMSTNVMQTIQFAMTSMMNTGSVFGLPIPLISLLILMMEMVVKLFTDLFLSKLMELVNYVKNKLFNVGSKIKNAFNKIKIKKIKLKEARLSATLGEQLGASDEGYNELLSAQNEYHEAVDELMDALAMEGFALGTPAAWESS